MKESVCHCGEGQFNRQLRAWRREKRLSQTDVAEILEVARSTYIRYENGDTMPTAYALVQISRVLSVPPAELYESFYRSNGYVSLADIPDYVQVKEREVVY